MSDHVDVPGDFSLATLPAYAPLFDASNNLIALVLDRRPSSIDSGRDQAGPILWATMLRSLKTLRAVLELCNRGYGEQAGMLCRALFEDMVVGHWVTAQPAERVKELVRTHAAHTEAIRREMLTKHQGSTSLALLPPLSDEQRRIVGQQANRRIAARLWTGKDVWTMLKDFEDAWPGPERATLWRAFDLSFRLSNLLLHNSPTAFEFVAPLGRLTSRPSNNFVDEALRAAYYAVSRLARAVLPGSARAELDVRIAADASILIALSNEEMRAGRNDPCPCGSRRKFKACHGA